MIKNLCFSEKKLVLSVSHQHFPIYIGKLAFFAPKPLFSHEGHLKDKIYSKIKNIILHHSKSFFLLFWGPVNEVGWKQEWFLKKFFDLHFDHFDSKMRFFVDFDFDPPLFWPETDKPPKQIGQDPQVSKTFLVTIGPKMTEKIQKVDPPHRAYRGGLVWNSSLWKHSTFYVALKENSRFFFLFVCFPKFCKATNKHHHE